MEGGKGANIFKRDFPFGESSIPRLKNRSAETEGGVLSKRWSVEPQYNICLNQGNSSPFSVGKCCCGMTGRAGGETGAARDMKKAWTVGNMWSQVPGKQKPMNVTDTFSSGVNACLVWASV